MLASSPTGLDGPSDPLVESSLFSFHFLRHLQHVSHAVPVARSAGDFKKPFHRGPWEFGPSRAVGEVDVEFAAFQMQFLGMGFEAGNDGLRFMRRFSR